MTIREPQGLRAVVQLTRAKSKRFMLKTAPRRVGGGPCLPVKSVPAPPSLLISPTAVEVPGEVHG